MSARNRCRNTSDASRPKPPAPMFDFPKARVNENVAKRRRHGHKTNQRQRATTTATTTGGTKRLTSTHVRACSVSWRGGSRVLIMANFVGTALSARKRRGRRRTFHGTSVVPLICYCRFARNTGAAWAGFFFVVLGRWGDGLRLSIHAIVSLLVAFGWLCGCVYIKYPTAQAGILAWRVRRRRRRLRTQPKPA